MNTKASPVRRSGFWVAQETVAWNGGRTSQRIYLRNDGKKWRLFLEPWGDEFDLKPGDIVEVELHLEPDSRAAELERDSRGLTIWAPVASAARVTRGESVLADYGVSELIMAAPSWRAWPARKPLAVQRRPKAANLLSLTASRGSKGSEARYPRLRNVAKS